MDGLLTPQELAALPRRSLVLLVASCLWRVSECYQLPADCPDRSKRAKRLNDIIWFGQNFANGGEISPHEFDDIRPAATAVNGGVVESDWAEGDSLRKGAAEEIAKACREAVWAFDYARADGSAYFAKVVDHASKAISHCCAAARIAGQSELHAEIRKTIDELKQAEHGEPGKLGEPISYHETLELSRGNNRWFEDSKLPNVVDDD